MLGKLQRILPLLVPSFYRVQALGAIMNVGFDLAEMWLYMSFLEQF